MWPVKHSNFFKQDNSYTTAFSFGDFGAQLDEQRFNVAPLHVPACWSSKDQFEGALVLPLHAEMVPLTGTEMARVSL